jgi:Bacterial Ig-like domain
MMLSWGCAQVKPIPGGDKDDQAPQVLYMQPSNAQTQFGSKSFVIVFDEYVNLQNIQTELIVSPPLRVAPQVIVRKKAVIVQWKEELLPNTTYNFQFGDGIVDVNEANKAENLRYVFSTGAILDSNEVSIRVVDNISGEPRKQIRVLLFDNDSSFLAAQPRPNYVSKTNTNGWASFSYLKSGSYVAYALDDQNGNYRPDDGEEIGLLKERVLVPSQDSLIDYFRLSKSIPQQKRIDNYQVDSTGVLHFNWPKSWGKVDVSPLGNQELTAWTDSANDSLWFFIKGNPTNQYVKVSVSDQSTLKDTLEIPFFKSANDRWTPKLTKKQYLPSERIELLSPQLMELINPIQELMQTKDSSIVQARWELGAKPNQMQLVGALKIGQAYQGWILPEAFKNNSGIANDSVSIHFTVLSAKELGSVSIDFTNLPLGPNYILELVNKNNEVTQQRKVTENKPLLLEQIIPDEYQIRLLEDRNNNGVADLTDVQNNVMAEPWIILSKSMTIRANWELKLAPTFSND